jgi:hypothetical protein
MKKVGLFFAHLEYITAIGIFYGHLIYLLHKFPRFGKLCQEKSGNPASDMEMTFNRRFSLIMVTALRKNRTKPKNAANKLEANPKKLALVKRCGRL